MGALTSPQGEEKMFNKGQSAKRSALKHMEAQGQGSNVRTMQGGCHTSIHLSHGMKIAPQQFAPFEDSTT